MACAALTSRFSTTCPSRASLGDDLGHVLVRPHELGAVADLVLRDSDRRVEDRVDVERHVAGAAVVAAERPEVPHDVAHAQRALARLVEHLPVLWIAAPALQHEAQVGQHVRQGVVDLVRDAGGEQPHARHALAALELLEQRLPLRDVARDEHGRHDRVARHDGPEPVLVMDGLALPRPTLCVSKLATWPVAKTWASLSMNAPVSSGLTHSVTRVPMTSPSERVGRIRLTKRIVPSSSMMTAKSGMFSASARHFSWLLRTSSSARLRSASSTNRTIAPLGRSVAGSRTATARKTAHAIVPSRRRTPRVAGPWSSPVASARVTGYSEAGNGEPSSRIVSPSKSIVRCGG